MPCRELAPREVPGRRAAGAAAAAATDRPPLIEAVLRSMRRTVSDSRLTLRWSSKPPADHRLLWDELALSNGDGARGLEHLAAHRKIAAHGAVVSGHLFLRGRQNQQSQIKRLARLHPHDAPMWICNNASITQNPPEITRFYSGASLTVHLS